MNKFLLAVVTLFSFVPVLKAQTGKLTGHLNDRGDAGGLVMAEVMVVEAGKKTFSDVEGNFEIDSLVPGSYHVKISPPLGMKDTVIVVKVNAGESTSIKLTAPFDCRYSVKNKRCPKCHKKDKAIPIVYGLIIEIKPAAGQAKGTNKRKKFYSGGCQITGCDPYWYCERDSLSY